MNVDDITSDEIPTIGPEDDLFELIFRRQHALAQRYMEIEARNGMLQTRDFPVNIDDRMGQARLKDFFWRVTEELTEAVDAARGHAHIPNHTIEELADALHFLVEAHLLAGIQWHDFGDNALDWHMGSVETPASLEAAVYACIHEIGCASNCLKQRPWKQTHQLVDRERFRASLQASMVHLLAAFKYCLLGPEEVFKIYWRKSAVNEFRMRSNY